MLGLKCFRRHLPEESGELVPGLLATMILVAIHINFEFVFMDFTLHYLFAIAAGMLVAIAAGAKRPAKAPAAVRLPPTAVSPAT